jgi:hypothetical protein
LIPAFAAPILPGARLAVFERALLQAWAAQAARFGYRVRCQGIGGDDAEVGLPTQMAVFELGGAG